MQDFYSNSARDLLLIGIPSVVLLLLGVFRLDTIFFASQKSKKVGWRGCGTTADGEPILVDPDGTVSLARPRRR